MKSILNLCEELPASEPEIRARAGEFNNLVAERVTGVVCCDRWLMLQVTMAGAAYGKTCNHEKCAPIQRFPDYLNSITDAKTATDRIIASATGGAWWEFWLHNTAIGFHCELYHREGYSILARVVAQASTEELARSAACVLAAATMKDGYPRGIEEMIEAMKGGK
jgi:hypothetical protein